MKDSKNDKIGKTSNLSIEHCSSETPPTPFILSSERFVVGVSMPYPSE